MPLFLHKETGALHPRTQELLEAIAQRVEKGGIEAWQGITAEELLGSESASYEKSRDTLDVWFDSGSTHFTVLRNSHREQSTYPADMYLEGSDQHRGWFHLALLTGCMLDGRAPYNSLLTHGFVIDLEGRKMSKSKGNTTSPQEISSTLGAETLRLWVASSDYSGELTISSEILKRVVESYRRIRNTLRFLLANTSDFDPRDALPLDKMVEIDRYALAMTAQMQEQAAEDYARYQFHLVAQRLQGFCSEDLGAFYLDILKDRLYTSRADSRARRSAQTALYHITHSLVRLMAPILSFTAEELWQVFGGKNDDSVFFHTMYELPVPHEGPALMAKWKRLRELREPVRKQIEALRSEDKVGASLQAEVALRAEGQDYEWLASLEDELKFLLITSAARVHRSSEAAVEVRPSEYRKCDRCWHYTADVDDEGLCARCRSNLRGPGETRRYV
jgi:isoleucyl-tRNA synthetase